VDFKRRIQRLESVSNGRTKSRNIYDVWWVAELILEICSYPNSPQHADIERLAIHLVSEHDFKPEEIVISPEILKMLEALG
jgi:hypothetical protein